MAEGNVFDKIDATQSSEIYRQLTQGKVVLKNQYNEIQDVIKENPLFTLMFNNWSHFSSLYQHLGYSLEFNDEGSFYYLKELTAQGLDEADTNAFKIQVVLLLIGRYFSRTGRNIDLLFEPNIGLDEADIEELKRDDEYSEILRTARFNKGWDEAFDFLAKRNFLFKTSAASLFISDAGKVFLLNLIDMYESK